MCAEGVVADPRAAKIAPDRAGGRLQELDRDAFRLRVRGEGRCEALASRRRSRHEVEDDDSHYPHVRSRVVVAGREPDDVSCADRPPHRIREAGHVQRARLVQDRKRLDQAPGRIRREEGPTAHVRHVERHSAAVQVSAACDEPSAFRHPEVRGARERRALWAGPGNVEDGIGAAVFDVEPDRLDRCQLRARDVAHGVTNLHHHRVRMVVHQHVEQTPGVLSAVGIAVALGQRKREALLSLRVEALGLERRWSARVVGDVRASVVGHADLREDDAVEHHIHRGDRVALRIDDVGAHPDDVAVDLGRRNQLDSARDLEARDGDRSGGEAQGLSTRSGRVGEQQRCDAGRDQEAREQAHLVESSTPLAEGRMAAWAG